jgi:hypothetical protein
MLGLLYSVGGASAGTVWALSGTSISPNNANTDQSSPTDAIVSWVFNTDGTIDTAVTAGTVQFQTGVEWDTDQVSPGTDMWVKATTDAGSAPTGSAVGVWHALVGAGAANRTFTWTYAGNDGFTTGTLQIDLATDAAGLNIVATGYYKGTATVTV